MEQLALDKESWFKQHVNGNQGKLTCISCSCLLPFLIMAFRYSLQSLGCHFNQTSKPEISSLNSNQNSILGLKFRFGTSVPLRVASLVKSNNLEIEGSHWNLEAWVRDRESRSMHYSHHASTAYVSDWEVNEVVPSNQCLQPPSLPLFPPVHLALSSYKRPIILRMLSKGSKSLWRLSVLAKLLASPPSDVTGCCPVHAGPHPPHGFCCSGSQQLQAWTIL